MEEKIIRSTGALPATSESIFPREYSVPATGGGYSSMQIREFPLPFVRIPCTHVRCTSTARTVNGYDSIPSRTGGSVEAMEEGHRRRKCREEDVDWCESLGERRMTPNVRPDREIRHTSDAPLRYPPPCPRCQPAITFPGVVSTSVLYRLLTYALTIGKISIC